MVASAPAMGKTTGALSLLGSANLVRPGLSSEQTFEQYVSPSPSATAATGPAPIAKSREVTIHLHEEGRGSELYGSIQDGTRIGTSVRLGVRGEVVRKSLFQPPGKA